jgi:hypothetical protein
MLYIVIYYLIGVIVSLYNIHYYRMSPKTNKPPKPSDGLGGLIGPWVWPLQIIKHMNRKK